MDEIVIELKALKVELFESKRTFEDFKRAFVKFNLLIDRFGLNGEYRNKLKLIHSEPKNESHLKRMISEITLLMDEICKGIVDENNAEYNDDYEATHFLASENSDLIKSVENYKISLSVEKEKYDNLIKQHQEKSIEYENTLEDLTQQNAKTKKELSDFKEEKQRQEIAKNSVRFQDQANANMKNAKLWIKAVVAAIIMFIILLILFLFSGEELFNIASNIQAKSSKIDIELMSKIIYIEIAKHLASKVLIYSMVIYLISFLVKNYNAQMHNYVVNSHKANALSSTVDLIGTAKSDDGNDKILAQATQAIFTTQRSGYQGVESEPNSPNVITNVIDAVMPKKG